MKNTRKGLAILLTIAMVLTMAMLATGCGDEPSNNDDDDKGGKTSISTSTTGDGTTTTNFATTTITTESATSTTAATTTTSEATTSTTAATTATSKATTSTTTTTTTTLAPTLTDEEMLVGKWHVQIPFKEAFPYISGGENIDVSAEIVLVFNADGTAKWELLVDMDAALQAYLDNGGTDDVFFWENMANVIGQNGHRDARYGFEDNFLRVRFSYQGEDREETYNYNLTATRLTINLLNEEDIWSGTYKKVE